MRIKVFLSAATLTCFAFIPIISLLKYFTSHFHWTCADMRGDRGVNRPDCELPPQLRKCRAVRVQQAEHFLFPCVAKRSSGPWVRFGHAGSFGFIREIHARWGRVNGEGDDRKWIRAHSLGARLIIVRVRTFLLCCRGVQTRSQGGVSIGFYSCCCCLSCRRGEDLRSKPWKRSFSWCL